MPFLPFSKAEAAVLAHKFLLNIGDHIAKSDILAPAGGKGNVRLSVENDRRTCTYLAETGYDVKFGARSIEQEVSKILVDMVGQYLAFATAASPACSGHPGEKEKAHDVTFTVKCRRADGCEHVLVSLDSY